MAVAAMRDGAYDFIEKPFPPNQLSAVIMRALEKRRLVLENRILREEIDADGLLDETLGGQIRRNGEGAKSGPNAGRDRH